MISYHNISIYGTCENHKLYKIDKIEILNLKIFDENSKNDDFIILKLR